MKKKGQMSFSGGPSKQTEKTDIQPEPEIKPSTSPRIGGHR